MTGGAALPVLSQAFRAGNAIESGKHEDLEIKGNRVLSIVRACLASGAADHVAYETPGVRSRKARRLPRLPTRRRRLN